MKLLLTFTLLVSVLLAGMPKTCQVPGHEGPPCHMGSCASFDKNGKQTGSRCSKDCAESCCGCKDNCNRHHENPDPEAHMRCAPQVILPVCKKVKS